MRQKKDLILIEKKADSFLWFQIKITEKMGEKDKSYTINIEDQTLKLSVAELTRIIKKAIPHKSGEAN